LHIGRVSLAIAFAEDVIASVNFEHLDVLFFANAIQAEARQVPLKRQ
jgi:hypothetical protein